jgi:hypothetical protein
MVHTGTGILFAAHPTVTKTGTAEFIIKKFFALQLKVFVVKFL